jgi:Leucine-rich repeat
MVEEPLKVGDPWSILPVKNAKYARDLIEVHLSNRDLDALEHFDDFPNLEVIWINGNKLKNLDAISTNFRVKKVYASDNLLENIKGLAAYKFLDTLCIGNNKLRNLDKFLEFLEVHFAFLEQLDLYGNPLAEEPDYRLKIIKAMPMIKLLDRHIITFEERLKADKLWEREHGDQTTKKKDQHQIIKPTPGQSFSKGERDLYREVDKLKALEEEKRRLEEEERANFYKKRQYQGIPVPSKKQENKDKFGGGNTEEALDDWEKNAVKKVFRADFDKDKQGI